MKGLAGGVDVGSKIPCCCLYLYGIDKFFSSSDFLAGFDLDFCRKVDVLFILEQPSALSPTESIRYIHS